MKVEEKKRMFEKYELMRKRVIAQSQTIAILNEELESLQDEFVNLPPLCYEDLRTMIRKPLWFTKSHCYVILLEVSSPDEFNNIHVKVLETDSKGGYADFTYSMTPSMMEKEGVFYRIEV